MQHFIKVGTLEVDGVRMQISRVQQPNVCESQQHSVTEASIPQSLVVEVSWSQANFSGEVLKMYLENKKRSGGGQVKDLSFSAEEQKAHVRFVDEECKLLLCCRSLLRPF